METLISEEIYKLYVIIKKLISHGKENSNFIRYILYKSRFYKSE